MTDSQNGTLRCIECGDIERKIIKTEKVGRSKRLTLECGHVRKLVSVRVQLKFQYVLATDPIEEIKRAQREYDYFKAITYACAVFEYYGKEILWKYFKKQGTPVKKSKLGFGLSSTIVMLYTHKRINHSIYSKMLAIISVRNAFMHRGKLIEIPSKLLEEAERKTPKALECVKEIKRIYESMTKASQ